MNYEQDVILLQKRHVSSAIKPCYLSAHKLQNVHSATHVQLNVYSQLALVLYAFTPMCMHMSSGLASVAEAIKPGRRLGQDFEAGAEGKFRRTKVVLILPLYGMKNPKHQSTDVLTLVNTFFTGYNGQYNLRIKKTLLAY